jgi:predicted TIM-barrel fold metal-dependent hydrolase
MFNTAWDVESTLPLFADMAELFGAERMMWGSNFPVDKLMRPYDFGVRVLLDCAERVGLNQVAVAGIFCDNARAFYRLEKDL